MNAPAVRQDDLMVGQRLAVSTAMGPSLPLKLGTYLWEGQILLDNGKVVPQEKCLWERTEPSEVPPFEVEIKKAVRAFYNTFGCLISSGMGVEAAQWLTIDKVECVLWNHGAYLAGRFRYKNRTYWVLISDLELPEEPSVRLSVVKKV